MSQKDTHFLHTYNQLTKKEEVIYKNCKKLTKIVLHNRQIAKQLRLVNFKEVLMNLKEKLDLISGLYVQDKKEFYNSLKIFGIAMITIQAVILPILGSVKDSDSILKIAIAAGVFITSMWLALSCYVNFDWYKRRKLQVEKTTNQLNQIGGIDGEE